jgi:TPR repeat protein
MNSPESFQNLDDFDAKLSAMTPEEAEKAVLAVEDKETLAYCLSEKAPFELVQKFAKRAEAVADLIEARFTVFEKGRIADAQGDNGKAKELYQKAGEMGVAEAFRNLAGIVETEGNLEEALQLLKKASMMGSKEAQEFLDDYDRA